MKKLPFISLIIGYVKAIFSLPFPVSTKLMMLVGIRTFLVEELVPVN